MVVESNCEVPEDLYYYIEGKNTVWGKLEGDVMTVGITDVAQTMAGKLVKVRLKKKGVKVDRGRPVATMESGKWAGAVPSPVSGEIVEVNEEVEKSPSLVNQDPYGKGWLVKLKVLNREELKQLYTSSVAVDKVRGLIQSEKIQCKRVT
ncbi:glycine cleavage system protein GcvH [Sulfodiicoccus acidiphilus]|nr:glycine cleavage system protein GcvH [Sulfodiicoccus acidiphilus]